MSDQPRTLRFEHPETHAVWHVGIIDAIRSHWLAHMLGVALCALDDELATTPEDALRYIDGAQAKMEADSAIAHEFIGAVEPVAPERYTLAGPVAALRKIAALPHTLDAPMEARLNLAGKIAYDALRMLAEPSPEENV